MTVGKPTDIVQRLLRASPKLSAAPALAADGVIPEKVRRSVAGLAPPEVDPSEDENLVGNALIHVAATADARLSAFDVEAGLSLAFCTVRSDVGSCSESGRTSAQRTAAHHAEERGFEARLTTSPDSDFCAIGAFGNLTAAARLYGEGAYGALVMRAGISLRAAAREAARRGLSASIEPDKGEAFMVTRQRVDWRAFHLATLSVGPTQRGFKS